MIDPERPFRSRHRINDPLPVLLNEFLQRHLTFAATGGDARGQLDVCYNASCVVYLSKWWKTRLFNSCWLIVVVTKKEETKSVVKLLLPLNYY